MTVNISCFSPRPAELTRKLSDIIGRDHALLFHFVTLHVTFCNTSQHHYSHCRSQLMPKVHPHPACCQLELPYHLASSTGLPVLRLGNESHIHLKHLPETDSARLYKQVTLTHSTTASFYDYSDQIYPIRLKLSSKSRVWSLSSYNVSFHPAFNSSERR